MVSKWQQNFNYWVDYSFNLMQTINGHYKTGTSLSHSLLHVISMFLGWWVGALRPAVETLSAHSPQMEPGLADKPCPRPSREPGLSEPPEWQGDTLFLGPDW